MPGFIFPTPTVGVLLLENTHLDVPGAMAHRETFAAPLHATVPGGHGDVVVGPDFERVAPAYASTARELRDAGADVVTANCGFAVAYQDEVARAAAPAALSSLLLLPLLVRVFAGGVGVLTYDAAELDDRRRALVPWPQDAAVPMAGVRHLPEWAALAADRDPGLDLDAMREQLVALAQGFVSEHGLRALLLECTGMFPFTDDVRRATGAATFDLNAFVNYLAAQLAPRQKEAADG